MAWGFGHKLDILVIRQHDSIAYTQLCTAFHSSLHSLSNPVTHVWCHVCIHCVFLTVQVCQTAGVTTAAAGMGPVVCSHAAQWLCTSAALSFQHSRGLCGASLINLGRTRLPCLIQSLQLRLSGMVALQPSVIMCIHCSTASHCSTAQACSSCSLHPWEPLAAQSQPGGQLGHALLHALHVC